MHNLEYKNKRSKKCSHRSKKMSDDYFYEICNQECIEEKNESHIACLVKSSLAFYPLHLNKLNKLAHF